MTGVYGRKQITLYVWHLTCDWT